MKNSILLTGLFIGLASIANAQNDSDNREKLQLGAKAGLSYANVYDTQGEEFDAEGKYGFSGGVFLTIPLVKYMGIQPELLFTQKGFRGTGKLLGGNYDFERTTTFLEIPILFALKPSEFITVLVGPQFSYLLNQKDVFTSSAISYVQEQEFKNDNIRKNILGVVGGLDFNINNVVISGRIGWDIQNNKGDGTSSTPRYKNVSSQFTIGYKFSS